MYGDRGVWIAKRLAPVERRAATSRSSTRVSSRPVLGILRSRVGSRPDPAAAVRDPQRCGEIVKYNHSKWMTITGHWGTSRRARGLPGPANWGNLAFSSDEQMQQIRSYQHTRAFLAAFTRTWKQRTSRHPGSSRVYSFGRMLPGATDSAGELIPEEPVFGEGIYKYLEED